MKTSAFLTGTTAVDPTSQLVPKAQSIEPFPCPHTLTPTFITPPMPPPPPLSPPHVLGWGLDLSITSPPSTCSTMPVWSLCCWEDCSCLVIPTSQPVERRGREGGGAWERGRGGEGGGKASALLPQSHDCWNADRSICHGLPSHTHLLSEGLTLTSLLLYSLWAVLMMVWSSWTPPLEIPWTFSHPHPLRVRDFTPFHSRKFQVDFY